MKTQIILEFEGMPDGVARAMIKAYEAYTEKQFRQMGFLGITYTQVSDQH